MFPETFQTDSDAVPEICSHSNLNDFHIRARRYVLEHGLLAVFLDQLHDGLLQVLNGLFSGTPRGGSSHPVTSSHQTTFLQRDEQNGKSVFHWVYLPVLPIKGSQVPSIRAWKCWLLVVGVGCVERAIFSSAAIFSPGLIDHSRPVVPQDVIFVSHNLRAVPWLILLIS